MEKNFQFYPISRLLSISIIIIGLIVFFQGKCYLKYFSGIEYIPQKVLNKNKNQCITHNLFRIQSHDCIVREFYCIIFIEPVIPGKVCDTISVHVLLTTMKKLTTSQISTVKTNIVKENVNLDFRLKKQMKLEITFRRNKT